MTSPKEVLENILAQAAQLGAEFCEAVVFQDAYSLKRIKYGQVDQPPAGEQWGIDIALVKNNRRKTLSVDSPAFAASLVKDALKHIDLLPEQEIVLPTEVFPRVSSAEGLFDIKTAEMNGQNLIEPVKALDEAMQKSNLLLSGKISQGKGEIVYGNSLGTRQETQFTSVSAAFFAFDKQNQFISAYTSSGGTSLSEIDTARMIEELRAKCLLQRDKTRIDLFDGKEEGEDINIDVIVEPYFFEPIFAWLGFFGFNGLFVERGESFISGKIGEKVMGENITIKDDPFDARSGGMGLRFDFEGRPRKQITLIEKGVAKNGVYDTALAAQWNKEPTGNALPPSARSEGAVPFDIVVEGGNSSIEEMIKNSKSPTLWITKLHYLGMKHYQTATMTGVAQHGVFLVENGEVKAPVENLRFEESIPEALKRVQAMSPSRLVFTPMGFGAPSGLVVPAMKIKDFRFVGSTKRTVS